MEALLAAAKQYILLASIYPMEKGRKATLIDPAFKLRPAYVQIGYSAQKMEIRFKDDVRSFNLEDIRQIKLSVCGRRVSLRQRYLLTLQVVLKNGAILEIETYDYAEGISLFKLAREKGAAAIEEHQIIELVSKYSGDMEGFYRYISANAKDFFKEHPYDERRLDYLLENKQKYGNFM